MPRIEDIGIFNAVRESGLNETCTAGATDCRGHGDLRPRQWCRRPVSLLRRRDRPQRHEFLSHQRGLLRAVLSRAAGERARARRAVAHPEPRSGQRCRPNSARRRRRPGRSGTHLLQDRRVGPHHRPRSATATPIPKCLCGATYRSSKARRRSCCATAA